MRFQDRDLKRTCLRAEGGGGAIDEERGGKEDECGVSRFI